MRISEAQSIWQTRPRRSGYRESIKALEADVQHANTLAAALPGDYDGFCMQMKLSYSPFASVLVYLVEWMDYSCTDSLPNYLGLLHLLVHKVHIDDTLTTSSHDRKASLREFYAVIYPSLMLLQDDIRDVRNEEFITQKRVEHSTKHPDSDRVDECTICMDSSNKIVLPDCGHSMCNSCFYDWNSRSQTCPFCRGSLETLESGDLWILTGFGDVIDAFALAKQNLRRFYRYIETLPLVMPETHLFIYDYLI